MQQRHLLQFTVTVIRRDSSAVKCYGLNSSIVSHISATMSRKLETAERISFTDVEEKSLQYKKGDVIPLTQRS
jgi:hypothetical protein